MVDLPLSPDPVLVSIQFGHVPIRDKSGLQKIIPNSKILHSLRSLLSSSNNLASIWRLLFFFSSSSPSCILWQAPIIRYASCSRKLFAHQFGTRYCRSQLCCTNPSIGQGFSHCDSPPGRTTITVPRRRQRRKSQRRSLILFTVASKREVIDPNQSSASPV